VLLTKDHVLYLWDVLLCLFSYFVWYWSFCWTLVDGIESICPKRKDEKNGITLNWKQKWLNKTMECIYLFLYWNTAHLTLNNNRSSVNFSIGEIYVPMLPYYQYLLFFVNR
jgi:hypothetical protein